MKNEKKSTTLIIISCIGSVLAFLLTPLLMYVIYTLYALNDPHVSITVGYWIGFVMAVIPLMAILYGYSLKLADKENKRYLWPLWVGLVCLVLTLILTFASLSIDMPLN